MAKTFRSIMCEEMAELHALAATWDTYGDLFRLEDKIKWALESIREYIQHEYNRVRGIHRSIERDKRAQARAITRGDNDPFWGKWIARDREALQEAEAELAARRAHRDELKDGLREVTRAIFGK